MLLVRRIGVTDIGSGEFCAYDLDDYDYSATFGNSPKSAVDNHTKLFPERYDDFDYEVTALDKVPSGVNLE